MADIRTNPGRVGSRRSPGLNNRGASVAIAVVCAAAAGVLIYLFVSKNKNSTPPPTTVTVYQATRYIAPGTPQALVAQDGMLKAVAVPSTQVIAGAITDPNEITGEVASAAIAPHQTITASDFTHSIVTISSYLRGDERAIAFALDPVHGLTAYIAQGSTVDIMGQSGGKTELLAQNVTVLANAGGDVILRVSDKQALMLSSATGVSSLWLTLRPVTGGSDSIRVGSVENS
jgi:Flp pilus assembly protein CpaB